MNDAEELAAIVRVLEEGVRRGWFEHVGVDEEGQQLYRLTVTGMEAVEAGFETGRLLMSDELPEGHGELAT
jgi:hypothetical protein